MNTVENLRIIVTREDSMFIAQCIEYDICTQAADMETLKERMNCLIEVELEDGQHIDPAPEKFHKMWDDASEKQTAGHEYRLANAA
jgi:hypothetical protein